MDLGGFLAHRKEPGNLQELVLGLGLSLYPGEDHLRKGPPLQRSFCNLDRVLGEPPGPKAEIEYILLESTPPAQQDTLASILELRCTSYS